MAELTTSQEAAVAAVVQQAYNTWLPIAQAAVLGGYERYGSAPDPNALLLTANAWRTQIQDIQNQALQPLAEQNFDEEAPDDQFSLGDALMVAAAAATTFFLMSQLGEIQSTLVNLTLAAGGTAAAAAAIAEYLSPDNPHWTAKAQQVAATEGDRWAQAATLSGAMKAQQADGIRRDKIWMTRRDSLVRDAHAHVQGQQRPLNQPFLVAGFPMMYPMDPAAPPQLVINCRCWIRIAKRGTDGRQR